MTRLTVRLLALAAVLVVPRAVEAQSVDFGGYALALGTYVGDTELGGGAGFSDFQRLRGMASWSPGGLHFDAAYEHTLLVREAGATGAQIFTSGGATSNGDWLDLGGVIEQRPSVEWRHRVDRLIASLDVGSSAELVVGRQPVSWATTLIFTPADPFSPFDPTDPFREYRQGVDAVRMRIYPNAVSEIDLVVRRSDFGFQETTTAAVRGSTSVRGWDLSGWAGVVHEDAALALAAAGSIGTWAVRAEGTLRDVEGRGGVLRTTVGVDRRFAFAGRDLYAILEFAHDGLGLRDLDELQELLMTDAVRRGELQSIGRDEAALQLSYQVHPLVGLSGLGIVNLRDGSVLFAPGAAVSATSSLSVGAGAFFGFGDGAGPMGAPLSEYGGVPGVGYVSLSWFR